MFHVSRVTVALCIVMLLANSAVAVGPRTSIPANFSDTLVASVDSPTALAFTPDGRLLITTQTGQLRVYQDGTLLSTPALDLQAAETICFDFERGLLGVAVDPDFANNHYIYLYYTFKKFNTCNANSADSPVNRVSRFTLSDGNVATDETVLVDNIPSPNGNHNAGDLHFGADGKLYISAGDGGCQLLPPNGCASANQNARRYDILSGKILRVNSDGTYPPDNPWAVNNPNPGAGSVRRCGDPAATPDWSIIGGPCGETFAWGLRNPFRFALDPNAAGTRFFINDVGQNTWEEIDEGQAGADYGWNVREGHCANGSTTDCGPPPSGMTNPIYDYGRSTGCSTITGGAFVPSGIWPAEYDGAYMFSDYNCGEIFKLTPAGGGNYTATPFATGLGNSSAVTMIFGPYNGTQALYYTTYANGGQVRRITYTGSANRAPIAVATANPTSGAAPLTVTFDGSSSNDPDGDSLAYDWDFGDGTDHTNTVTTTHTYATGTYTATLQVSDGRGGVGTATVRIDSGNTPPVPVITAPPVDLRFRVGQSITLQGSATDQQDGTLSGADLSWRVILHHNDHTHPFLPPTTGVSVTITTPAPEDLAATKASYLEIQLTATDSQGLTGVVTQTLQPHLVDVTFATIPAGLMLIVNGGTITSPQTLISWEGYALHTFTPPQPDSTGRWLALDTWSDGDENSARTIITPSSAITYTAIFTPANVVLLPAVYR
jgi:glucose/arabinose dehydrogenase